jgi:hypothetical protein
MSYRCRKYRKMSGDKICRAYTKSCHARRTRKCRRMSRRCRRRTVVWTIYQWILFGRKHCRKEEKSRRPKHMTKKCRRFARIYTNKHCKTYVNFCNTKARRKTHTCTQSRLMCLKKTFRNWVRTYMRFGKMRCTPFLRTMYRCEVYTKMTRNKGCVAHFAACPLRRYTREHACFQSGARCMRETRIWHKDRRGRRWHWYWATGLRKWRYKYIYQQDTAERRTRYYTKDVPRIDRTPPICRCRFFFKKKIFLYKKNLLIFFLYIFFNIKWSGWNTASESNVQVSTQIYFQRQQHIDLLYIYSYRVHTVNRKGSPGFQCILENFGTL